MASLAKMVYGTPVQATITLASLATSSTFVAGSESDVIDNTSNLHQDYRFGGKIRVGTTPTVNTEIRVFIVPIIDTSGSLWPDVFDGTTSAETITSQGAAKSAMRLAAVMDVDATTSDRDYFFDVGSVSSLFGGICPPKFSIFVAHNTGVNLNSTGGNHALWTQGVHTNLNA